MPKPYWTDGQVTLHLGDCREILPSLGVEADCIVADPPYGETSLVWDHWPDGWLDVAATVTRSLWCFGSLRMFMCQRDQFAAWRMSQDVVWEKPRPRSMSADRFARSHECVTHWYRGAWADLYKQTQTMPYYGKPVRATRTADYQTGGRVHAPTGAAEYAETGTRLMTTVLKGAAGDPRCLLHPTQKPAEVLSPLLSYSCPPGGLVLDPFAGSGSTLDAARQAGRRAIGIEADEEYAEKAARRLSQGVLALDIPLAANL